jgi:SAM-dependent methyltransferase
MDQPLSDRTYVLGHSEQELSRLEQQGELFGSETRDVYRRAGLAPGMRVLNIGCGAGDDALIAADLVGPEGSVLGIDRAPAALSLARARAERAGLKHMSFAEDEIYSFQPEAKFDAVIGRFILLHVADAVGALKRVQTFLKPGGILAFVELDINQAGAIPPLPLLDRCIAWIVETYRRAGVEPNMGSGLYAAFRAAGLAPKMTGTCRIVSGPDAVAYPFTAQTIASLIPTMEKLGVATAAEIGIETLADRLRHDAVAGDHCIFLPRLVGAWARLPA